MRKKELIRLNKELDQMAHEDEISAYDSLPPHEKELLEVNKLLDRMAPNQIASGENYLMPLQKPKTQKKQKRRNPKPPQSSRSKTTNLNRDFQKELLILESQALTKQAEEEKGNINFVVGLFLASLVSIFIPGFFEMGLVLMGLTYYMYYKAKKKLKEIEVSAEEVRVRIANNTSQD